MSKIILASTSKYRKELLSRICPDFEAVAPTTNEDEYKKTIKDPYELAKELAFQKAKSVARAGQIVVGSDQVCCLGERIFGKPQSEKAAFESLKSLQGQIHYLYTGVCLITEKTNKVWVHKARMKMRHLSDIEMKNYILIDQPFDCAGSYKLEKMGITLFDEIDTDDFTGIQGLPLLQLALQLRKLGIFIPDNTKLLEKS